MNDYILAITKNYHDAGYYMQTKAHEDYWLWYDSWRQSSNNKPSPDNK